MATTAEVLTSPTLARLRAENPSLSLPCLVPNDRGMHALSTLMDKHAEPLTNEVALFVAASEGFSRANLNKSVAEALAVQPSIFEAAKKRGLKVRAYVSVVLGCPFEGYIDPKKAARVAKELLDMGAYEVSLGDTIGVGVPRGWEELLNECERAGVPVDKVAVRFGFTLACLWGSGHNVRLETEVFRPATYRHTATTPTVLRWPTFCIASRCVPFLVRISLSFAQPTNLHPTARRPDGGLVRRGSRRLPVLSRRDRQRLDRRCRLRLARIRHPVLVPSRTASGQFARMERSRTGRPDAV